MTDRGSHYQPYTRYRTRISLLVALCVLMAGCTLTLISPYDDLTDKAVADLQKKVDTFLISLERATAPPSCTHASNGQFYVDSLASVSSLIVRNEGRPKNVLTNQQLQLLQDSLTTLEELHEAKGEAGCLSPEEIEPIRRNLNSSFTAITKLELAKKRGKKGDE